MVRSPSRRYLKRLLVLPALLAIPLVSVSAIAFGDPAPSTPWQHGSQQAPLSPGNLLVATSTFVNDPNIVAGSTQLPPGCSTVANASDPCGTAVADGNYPYIFNNDTVDGSFGVTSPIRLLQLTPDGSYVGSISVPNSTDPSVSSSADQMVTSFSSKSELALNLSPNGQYVTFMGYNAPVDQADVSNANTPGDIDPTAADPGAYYRVAAQLGADGKFHFTETNAFSGDNGRAAITATVDGKDYIYAAGNAGNGANPEPQGVVTGAGAQLIQPAGSAESAQSPGQPTPVGSFSVTELGGAPDKVAKDNNYRGLTVYNNVLYYTKGSGGNGVDTVYFVDTTGKACPNGVGLPASGASLPTTSTPTYDATAGGTITKKGVTTNNPGLEPQNMCILKGFPTVLAAGATDASDYPFGMWFANPDTIYLADEGSGDNANTTFTASTNGTYSAAAASTTAGLQKWVFDSTTQQWNLAYTLQAGLELGKPYVVPLYPVGLNDGQGGSKMPWAPATDGLRNITGEVNRDGTVTIYGVTSTVSGSGDQGADPNELVKITDRLSATTLPSGETFTTVLAPRNGVVVRGVSLTPGTQADDGSGSFGQQGQQGDGQQGQNF